MTSEVPLPPLVDPGRPPLERLQSLQAVAMGLSPMHPATWRRIMAEARAAAGELAGPVEFDEATRRFLEAAYSADDGLSARGEAARG